MQILVEGCGMEEGRVRFCVSSKFPGDASVAGPHTVSPELAAQSRSDTRGIARGWRHAYGAGDRSLGAAGTPFPWVRCGF